MLSLISYEIHKSLTSPLTASDSEVQRGTRLEKLVQNFFIKLSAQQSTILQISQRLRREAKLTNLALFRKFGTKLPCFPPVIPRLHPNIYSIIFKFVDSAVDQKNIALTCQNFNELIKAELDASFLKLHLLLEIKDGNFELQSKEKIPSLLISYYNRISGANEQRATRWIGLLCELLEKSTTIESQLFLFQHLLLQWDKYRSSLGKINPQPFLSAFYNHKKCPKALQLYLSLPTIHFSTQCLDDSICKERNMLPSTKEQTHIFQSFEEVPTCPIANSIYKEISLNSRNKFQLGEAVVICYKASSISTPLFLYGRVEKEKKDGCYAIKFKPSNTESKTLIFKAQQIGKLPLHCFSNSKRHLSI